MGLFGQIVVVVLGGGSGLFMVVAGVSQLRTYLRVRLSNETVESADRQPRDLLTGGLMWLGLGLLFLGGVAIGLLTGVEPGEPRP